MSRTLASARYEDAKPLASALGVSQLLGRVIFAALLAIIILTAIPYGTVDRWWVALFECAIFALTILWLIEGLLSGTWLVRAHYLLLPIVILIAYCCAQTLPLAGRELAGVHVWQTMSADPYQTRLVALKLLALALAGGMLFRYTSSMWRIHALIYTIIAVGVLSAVFGLIRQTTQHDSPGFILPYIKSGYAQFINQNHFAFLMEMALGLALGLIVGGIRRDQILIYLALALPLWTTLVLSRSRGGLFAMLAQVLFLGFIYVSLRTAREMKGRESNSIATARRSFSRSILLRAILLVCLAVMVFVGAIWVAGEPLVTRLETVPGEVSKVSLEDGAGVDRKAVWQATWKLIKDHPIVGVGFGGYWAAIPQYHHASGQMTPQEAHNDYLELMASGGIIGLGILGWFLSIFIGRIRARLRLANTSVRAATIGALAGLFGVAVHSCVDFGLHITINALVFMALLVIAAGDVGEKGAPSTGLMPRS